MKDSDIKVVGLSNSKVKGKTNWKIIGALFGILVLAVGIIAGIVLVKQNQNFEEKASCTAACPDSREHLINCYNTDDTDGDDSPCAWAGRIEICGQTAADARQYCCPEPNGRWTTNLNLCNTAATATATATATTRATATATATSTGTSRATATATSSSRATATSTGTSRATATATSSSRATATSTATAFPVPDTGASIPTILGAGFGIIMIFVSMALAL